MNFHLPSPTLLATRGWNIPWIFIMVYSVVTIVSISLFWLCLIFVAQRRDRRLVCVKKIEENITWCSLLSLKTAEGATVLKENYFECQIFKTAIKSRLQASWKSKYCHMQWWHKGSEVPIKNLCRQQNKIRKLSSISSFCVVEDFCQGFLWEAMEKTKMFGYQLSTIAVSSTQIL